MAITLSEVRLNEYYAVHSLSEYPGDDPAQESLPKINRRVMRSEVLFEKIKDLSKENAIDYKVDHLFPPNCRYFEKHNNGYFVVIEEPPAFRTIMLDKDISGELASLKSLDLIKKYGYEDWVKIERPPYRFTVAIPYAVFFLTFSKNHDVIKGRVFFRTKPISGFTDPLFKTPFTNISDNQNICFGDQIHKGPKTSIFASVNHAIGVFWNAIFNVDYIYNYEAYQAVPGLCDWLTWEYYSNKDPMFIYTADWIPFRGATVGGEVEHQRHTLNRNNEDDQNNERNRYSFMTLAKLFNQAKEEEKIKVPDKTFEDALLYDVTQTLILNETIVNVGDTLRDKSGRLYFVDSFIGFRKMLEASYVSLQREDGYVIRMRLTQKTREFIDAAVKQERYISEYKLDSGDTIKAGDIISFEDMNKNRVYRKIKYIRQNAIGEVELSAGSEYYIANNLPADCHIVDLESQVYFGTKLEVGNEYLVYTSDEPNTGQIFRLALCVLEEITTNTRQNLVYRLKETTGANRGHNYRIPLNENNTFKRIFSFDDVKTLPTVFAIGRKLHFCGCEDFSGNLTAKHAYFIPDVGGVGILPDTRLRDIPSTAITNDEFGLLKDDTLRITSPDLELEFSIGDKVVVANWENPVDMLTVKQIQGFVEDKAKGELSFTLSDKNGNMSIFPYINMNKSSIKIGSVRKITNTFGDLTAGMKISANKPGISMFPKKDTNIIVGFLYDTGGPEPLVLCSNACTLWYSDVIEKFDKIKITDPEWPKLKHAPISPSKIRYQPGDILDSKKYYRNAFGYVVFKPMDGRSIRAANLKYYGSYADSYVFDKGFTYDVFLDCFPNPRLAPKKEGAMGFINAYPNFHGMFRSTGQYNSPYMVINEKRSMLNVSSDNK